MAYYEHKTGETIGMHIYILFLCSVLAAFLEDGFGEDKYFHCLVAERDDSDIGELVVWVFINKSKASATIWSCVVPLISGALPD